MREKYSRVQRILKRLGLALVLICEISVEANIPQYRFHILKRLGLVPVPLRGNCNITSSLSPAISLDGGERP